MRHLLYLEAVEIEALKRLYYHIEATDVQQWPEALQDAFLSAGAKLERHAALEATAEKKELVA